MFGSNYGEKVGKCWTRVRKSKNVEIHMLKKSNTSKNINKQCRKIEDIMIRLKLSTLLNIFCQ